MADDKYIYDLRQLIEALIKDQGLHEGYWGIGLEFGFGAATFGQTAEEAMPTAFVQVSRVRLVRGESELPLCIDASKINPKDKKTSKLSDKRKSSSSTQ